MHEYKTRYNYSDRKNDRKRSEDIVDLKVNTIYAAGKK